MWVIVFDCGYRGEAFLGEDNEIVGDEADSRTFDDWQEAIEYLAALGLEIEEVISVSVRCLCPFSM